MIDAEAVETHGAAGVALRALLRDLRVPALIAVNRCDDPVQAQWLARSLGALDGDAVVACQLNDPDSGREVVVEILRTLSRRWSQRSRGLLDKMQHSETEPGSAETAALWASRRQPAPVTLNEARDAAFTGEIEFGADPEVMAYPRPGRRLLRRACVRLVARSTPARRRPGRRGAAQARHGERRWDRSSRSAVRPDPSIDPDAVILMVSNTTDELVAELANRVVVSVRATAYRHHPSGVHRWFLAPFDLASVTSRMSPTHHPEPSAVGDVLDSSFDDVDSGELTIARNDVDSAADGRGLDQLNISMFEMHLDEAPRDLAPRDLAPRDLAPRDLVADELVIEEFDLVERALPDDEPMTTPQDEVEPELVVPPLALVGDAAPEATGDANDDLAEAVRRVAACPCVVLRHGTAQRAAGDAGGGEGGDPDDRRSALRRLIGSVGRTKS